MRMFRIFVWNKSKMQHSLCTQRAPHKYCTFIAVVSISLPIHQFIITFNAHIAVRFGRDRFFLVYSFPFVRFQLLELDPRNRKADFLREFPPIATKYVLASFFCTWKTNEIAVIKSMLHRMTLPITNEQTVSSLIACATKLEPRCNCCAFLLLFLTGNFAGPWIVFHFFELQWCRFGQQID